ncbi:hypothetical protein LEMLEM_LOCUS3854, partial [Lemmus lemmus]
PAASSLLHSTGLVNCQKVREAIAKIAWAPVCVGMHCGAEDDLELLTFLLLLPKCWVSRPASTDAVCRASSA